MCKKAKIVFLLAAGEEHESFATRMKYRYPSGDEHTTVEPLSSSPLQCEIEPSTVASDAPWNLGSGALHLFGVSSHHLPPLLHAPHFRRSQGAP